jgi:hypothetical protein
LHSVSPGVHGGLALPQLAMPVPKAFSSTLPSQLSSSPSQISIGSGPTPPPQVVWSQ